MKFVSNWMNLSLIYFPVANSRFQTLHVALPSYLSNGPNTQLIGCFGLLDASSSASLAFRFRPRL